MSIRDLARHLNISIGTVSRALNGRSDVSPETRRRVLDAARTLNYAPNQSGRSLRQGTTDMVAFLMEMDRGVPLSGTIFMSVLDGLRSLLAERNLDLMVLMCGPGEDGYTYLRRVADRRLADGIIICETRPLDPRIDYLLERKIPFVAFGRSLSRGDYPWVDLDFEDMAERSIDRLTKLGHKRIAIVVRDSEVNYNSLFAEACRRALRRRGLRLDPALLLKEQGTQEGGYRLGELLLSMRERPTAVLLVQNEMTVGLYRRLTEAGLTPGKDVAIMGCLEEASSRFLSPKLTAFKSDLAGLGARLGEALAPRMRPGSSAELSEPIREVWPMELVAGESDGHPPEIGLRRRAR